MKIFNDNINLLIVLLFASLAYITIFKGHWSDKIKLTDVYNTDLHIKLSRNTIINPSYAIEPSKKIFTIDGNLDVLNDSISVDTLLISLSEINGKNIQDNKKIAVNTNLKGKQEIHETFEYTSTGSQRFLVGFSFKESTGKFYRTSVELKRTKNFELAARNERDLAILLYPALWIAFGVLVLIKITKLVRSDDPDNNAEKPKEEEDYL